MEMLNRKSFTLRVLNIVLIMILSISLIALSSCADSSSGGRSPATSPNEDTPTAPNPDQVIEDVARALLVIKISGFSDKIIRGEQIDWNTLDANIVDALDTLYNNSTEAIDPAGDTQPYQE